MFLYLRSWDVIVEPEKCFFPYVSRYELSGKCQDPDCRAQHADQYQLTSDELVLDLLLYCPALLGEKIGPDTNIESLLTVSAILLHFQSQKCA